MVKKRAVLQDCRNASNPYHVCSEYCSIPAEVKAHSVKKEPDVVQPIASEDRVPVGKYRVKSSVSSILRAILEKYGDIAENCKLESIAMRSYYLECLCSVVQELQSLMNLTKSRVKEMAAIVKDLESSHIEVGWLKAILDEVTDFVSHHQTIKAAKVKIVQALESARRELDSQVGALALKEQELSKLKARAAETEAQLQELEAEASKLDETVSSINSLLQGNKTRVLLTNHRSSCVIPFSFIALVLIFFGLH